MENALDQAVGEAVNLPHADEHTDEHGALAHPRLRHYLNARVTVHYNSASGYSDNGTLTYVDAAFAELTKDNGERLLMPLLSIRIIKLLEAPKLEGDAAILLRPAGGRAPQEQVEAGEKRRLGR